MVSFNSGETLEKHRYFEPSFPQGKVIKSFYKPYLTQSFSLGIVPGTAEAHGGNNCPTPLLGWDLSGWLIKAAFAAEVRLQLVPHETQLLLA